MDNAKVYRAFNDAVAKQAEQPQQSLLSAELSLMFAMFIIIIHIIQWIIHRIPSISDTTKLRQIDSLVIEVH